MNLSLGKIAALGLLLAGCGGGDGSQTTAEGGGGAGAGSPVSTSTTVASTSGPTSAHASSAAATSGSGGALPAACQDPDAFWSKSAVKYGFPMPASMCAYLGDVVLVVNTAEL